MWQHMREADDHHRYTSHRYRLPCRLTAAEVCTPRTHLHHTCSTSSYFVFLTLAVYLLVIGFFFNHLFRSIPQFAPPRCRVGAPARPAWLTLHELTSPSGCGAIDPRRYASRQDPRRLEATGPKGRDSRSQRCSQPAWPTRSAKRSFRNERRASSNETRLPPLRSTDHEQRGPLRARLSSPQRCSCSQGRPTLRRLPGQRQARASRTPTCRNWPAPRSFQSLRRRQSLHCNAFGRPLPACSSRCMNSTRPPPRSHRHRRRKAARLGRVPPSQRLR